MNIQRALHVTNEATKFAVSATVFMVLVWRHDAHACWCVLGSILAAFNCKVLKHLINESRPEGARKADPGMPSSHAQSLGFLSAYVAADLAALGTSWSFPSAALVAILGIFLSWLRIALKYHTPAQVVAGHLLGTCSALIWRLVGEAYSLQILQDDSGALFLYVLTFIAVVAFIGRTGAGWLQESLKNW